MSNWSLHDIVLKLAGPIRPIGDTSKDRARLANLEQLIDLVDRLLFDIHEVSGYANRPEASIRSAGLQAQQALRIFHEAYEPPESSDE